MHHEVRRESKRTERRGEKKVERGGRKVKAIVEMGAKKPLGQSRACRRERGGQYSERR